MTKLKFEAPKRVRKTKTAAGSGTAAPAAKAPSTTKLATITALLQRPDGARMEELMAATGWQAHSVRGALSGTIKNQLKLALVSEKSEAGRVYRIASPVAA